MRLKYRFEQIILDDEYIAVPIGDDANGVSGILKLNKGGAEILELLYEDTTVCDIVEKISNEYDDDTSILCDYVESFIDELRHQGLILD